MQSQDASQRQRSARGLLAVPEDRSMSFSGRGRKEVARIVRRIMPDRCEDVDEMIEQYQGREDQLLESLRKMQEAHEAASEASGRVDPDDFIFDDDEDDDDEEVMDGLVSRGVDENVEGEDEGSWSSSSSSSDDGRFDVDRWRDDLDSQLDDSSKRSDHSPLPLSNPQSGGGTLKLPLSNPQGGGGGMLKTPPEQLIAAAENGHAEEEKKNDSSPAPAHVARGLPPPMNDLSRDEDENDVPPPLPQTVGTGSMRGFLKISSLTNQSSSVRSFDDGSEGSEESKAKRRRDGVAASPSGRRAAAALIRIRAWDPARPGVRVNFSAYADVTLGGGPDDGAGGAVGLVREDTPDPRLVRRPRREGSDEEPDGGGGSQRRRLSMVKEEPEKPPHRGDSYFDDVLKNSCLQALEEIDKDDDENDAAANSHGGGGSMVGAGALVGIQLNTSSCSSSYSKQQHLQGSNQSAMSFTLKRDCEWKEGNPISIHNVQFLSLSDPARLHLKIERNCSSLRELVMDGLPPGAFAPEEAELIFEALGANTSIKRLSMRYSSVGDELASLLALALVDNTNMTQLSLEGNEMTDVSAKNFYSVLKKNNETLRLLDLNDNPDIDEEVETALDRFMEQRALKRTLTNKAERARRVARGMPPDATLDDDDDDEADGRVAVVCAQSSVEELLEDVRETDEERNAQQIEPNGRGQRRQRRHAPSDERHVPSNESDGTRSAIKPRPGERFRDYMHRMDSAKRVENESPSFNLGLMNESLRDRDAFDNFSAMESLHAEQRSQQRSERSLRQPSQDSSQKYHPLARKDQYVREALDTSAHSAPRTLPPHLNDSIGSSITTRSTHLQESERDVITTTSNRTEDPSDGSRGEDGAASSPPRSAARGRARAPPARSNSPETLESADDDDGVVRAVAAARRAPRRMDTVETQESATTGANYRRLDTLESADDAEETRPRKPPRRADTMETQESAMPGDNFRRMDTLESADEMVKNSFRRPPGRTDAAETQQSDDGILRGANPRRSNPYGRGRNGPIDRSITTVATEASAAPRRSNPYGRGRGDGPLDKSITTVATEASAAPEGRGPAPAPPPPPTRPGAVAYHPTQTSHASGSGSNPSLDIGEGDYMDAKANEREIRRRLAAEGGAVGAYQIDEVAPARQNRSSGGGAAAGGRRGRQRRSESARLRRLLELEGGGDGGGRGGGGGGAEASRRGGSALRDEEEVLNADIEMATEDQYLDDMVRRMGQSKSSFATIGMGDEDQRCERMTCRIIAVLLVGLLVMVAMLLMNHRK